MNSAIGIVESLRFGSSLRKVEIHPPLFILGHWRSGTTFLQNLMAVDHRFASPTLYEVLFPHIFLSTERLLSPVFSRFLPSKRYTDNVPFGLHVPYEDEFAICAMSLSSPLVGMAFPNATKYDSFLTLRDVSEAEFAVWKAALLGFLRKSAYKHRRPLILKSPPHTARVRRLLQVFPTAKFLHVYRNPYEVFQSSVKNHLESSRRQRLQLPRNESIEDHVIRVYKEMHDAYFEDRPLIAEENLHELSFEELKRDPTGELRRAYEQLCLPDFDVIDQAVGSYLSRLVDYEQAVHPQLDAAVRQRLAREWKKCFDEWGYST